MKFNEKLLLLRKKINTGRELMGSKWQNMEAEYIACETICACGKNLEDHGEAFSWQGMNTKNSHGWKLIDNPKGVRSLLSDSSLLLEEYDNPKKLPIPESTVISENGKPMVFRCTEQLLDYTIKFMNLK